MLKPLPTGKSWTSLQKWFAVIAATMVIAGCSTDFNPPPAPSAMTTGATIGAVGGGIIGSTSIVGAPLVAWFGSLAGAAIGNRLDQQMTLLKEIQDNGVTVFLIGDTVKLVLPSDKFFTPGAPTFNTYSARILDKITLFLNQYPMLNVKVSAYIDNKGLPERNLALSKEQAEWVADYLWNHGLDARLIYARGYGSLHAVASNTTAYGRAANRRIEISLQRLSAKPL